MLCGKKLVINYYELYPTGAQESLNEKVQLKPCETYELSRVQTPADYQAIANSSEALEGIEACMEVWIKQIEQVC